ncbi:Eco57I restriction-modification methylase domain-containing protein [Nocardia sp. NBC_01329]|uniref:Eco57I restriction-modification methylase domain-containing protein n=1 Tax=Nocardia sp. NBC_01329 TaxID=2903594 RepID=UPI002E14E438|nr:methyltransferase domain-containing protein [Nocardia sp. NBC_01329]
MGRDGAGARERKRHGRHYTPATLAGFLAGRVVARIGTPGRVRVLDPACGSGELLFAIKDALADRLPGVPVELTGYDLDPAGLVLARRRAAESGVGAEWRQRDFLADCAGLPAESFDAVIANPPYVRTQQLGGEAAQALRGQFGLRGRIDLTHPFVAALPRLMAPGAVLGLLCANRFLTTKAGSNLRGLLLADLTPVELYDLGDTKLFEAAVLPAVTIAVRGATRGTCRYVSVYEEEARAVSDTGTAGSVGAIPAEGARRSDRLAEYGPVGSIPARRGPGAGLSGGRSQGDAGEPTRGSETAGASGGDRELFVALGGAADTTVSRQGRRFAVTVGELATEPGPAAASVGWRMSRMGHDDWLRGVSDRMWRTFGDLGRIRVGIKTNADKVFIAVHWGDPAAEPELLRDLITHHDLRPWRIDRIRETRVLYPYDLTRTRRVPVDLARYPRTAAYLEQHREVLTARDYLTGAGRKWFEHWVPQRPHLWRIPKVVFPDISDRPRFALDRSGAVVNGDCYWISLADLGGGAGAEDLACLMMGVANSSLGLRYYDAVCGNRLYSGRRRWITQYVSRLPLPDPGTPAATAIVCRVRALAEEPETGAAGQEELDELVHRAFAL